MTKAGLGGQGTEIAPQRRPMARPARCARHLRDAALSVLFLAGALAGCAAPPTPYDLNAAALGGALKGAGAVQIAIHEPTALPPLDSNRIVVRLPGDSIALLKGSAWADRLPPLVQAKLVESFQKKGLRAAEPGMAADYGLLIDIRRFELDPARATAFVEISGQITAASGRIVAAKVFSSSAPAPHDDGATVTGALGVALSNVLGQILRWTAAQI